MSEQAKQTIEDRIKRVIVEQLGAKEEQVTPETTFISLGADSLDMIELVMATEEEFGFEIPDEDTDGLTTVGKAIEYIERRSNPDGN